MQMKSSKILIVEDEQIVAKDIQHSLENLGYQVTDVVFTHEKVFSSINANKPDLILLDIMLNGTKTGIELAHEIKNQFKLPVVFLTAYADDQTIQMAKITEPHGYIIKPFSEPELKKTIELAIFKFDKEELIRQERDLFFLMAEKKDVHTNSIFIRSNSRLIRIKNSDILYVEALKDYVIIHLQNEKFVVHITMKEILQKLPSNEFIRIHRSFIVHENQINTIEYPNLLLGPEKISLPIGGSYRDELLGRLNLV